MAIFLIMFMLYSAWGLPALVVFNFFLPKKLIKTSTPSRNFSISFFSTVALFMPFVIQSTSFFGQIYAPWYVSFLLSPPAPDFSALGFLATAAASVTTTLLTILIYSKNKKDILANIFSKFEQ